MVSLLPGGADLGCISGVTRLYLNPACYLDELRRSGRWEDCAQVAHVCWGDATPPKGGRLCKQVGTKLVRVPRVLPAGIQSRVGGFKLGWVDSKRGVGGRGWVGFKRCVCGFKRRVGGRG